MQSLPTSIIDFIQHHHVVSLACHFEQNIWCASCFYIFDPQQVRLIFLSKQSTFHGQLMQKNPQIAGTISAQPTDITQIEGVQFQGIARCFTQSMEKREALAQYIKRFPIAKQISSDIWEIQLSHIKHTQNKFAFAQKTIWER